jgi:hypothetical protein
MHAGVWWGNQLNDSNLEISRRRWEDVIRWILGQVFLRIGSWFKSLRIVSDVLSSATRV